jgi:arabinogalactan endo-1,4-beta-galactosidase
MKRTLLALLLCLGALAGQAQQKLVGGDISLLPEYASSTYKDHSGRVVQPLDLFKSEGLNAMRVRLFVDPDRYTGSDKDANACQDLEYVKALGRQIKEAGFRLMLDFHYSDTWADPAKQWTPAAWASLSDEELYTQIYDYTREVLQEMKAAGAEPDLIQTGNEISYGMLWGAYGSSSLKKVYTSGTANWSYFTTLLRRACQACREVCPEAKIVIHTERVANTTVLKEFYSRVDGYLGDAYDVIGLSYYPYYHGTLTQLEAALKAVESVSTKEIMIVEAGYPYAWAVPGTTMDYSATYPYTEEGQRQFTADLITTLNQHQQVTGLFWWWMEYNAYGAGLSGWYNAPLFDSRTGKALSALSELQYFLHAAGGISEEEVSAVECVSAEVAPAVSDSRCFRLNGVRVSGCAPAGLFIRDGKVVALGSY